MIPSKNNTDTLAIVALILAITLIPSLVPQWFVSATGNISVMETPAFFVILGFIFHWKRTALVALFLYSISFALSLHLAFSFFDKGAAFALIACLHVPLLYLLYKKTRKGTIESGI